jgi:hypothetical protein
MLQSRLQLTKSRLNTILRELSIAERVLLSDSDYNFLRGGDNSSLMNFTDFGRPSEISNPSFLQVREIVLIINDLLVSRFNGQAEHSQHIRNRTYSAHYFVHIRQYPAVSQV